MRYILTVQLLVDITLPDKVYMYPLLYLNTFLPNIPDSLVVQFLVGRFQPYTGYMPMNLAWNMSLPDSLYTNNFRYSLHIFLQYTYYMSLNRLMNRNRFYTMYMWTHLLRNTAHTDTVYIPLDPYMVDIFQPDIVYRRYLHNRCLCYKKYTVKHPKRLEVKFYQMDNCCMCI